MSSSSNDDSVATINIPINISIRVGSPTVEARTGGAVIQSTVAAAPAGSAPPIQLGRVPENDPQGAFEIDDDYSKRKGYDENWLATPIPLPTLSAAQLKDASLDQTREDGDRHVLKYYNFSLSMSAKKRLLFFAACNTTRDPKLMGKGSRTSLSDGKGDKWVLDPRIPAAHQITTRELYSKIHFDRGHIVRREDAFWGKTQQQAAYGNFDSFHYTNCTPQDKSFNRSTVGDGLWGKLENHIAESAVTDGQKLSYFAGPIFRGGRTLDDVFVPYEFFKVVVAERAEGKLGVWAFRLSQQEQVDEAQGIFEPDDFKTYVVSIPSLEKLTGLTFPEVMHKLDVKKGASADQLFDSLGDIPMQAPPA